MPQFKACLLDYGNTIVEFDLPQINRVRAELTEILGRLVKPVPLTTVAKCLDEVCSLPSRGNPPAYRELTPLDQMKTLLESIYGEGNEFSPQVVRDCDGALQKVFVESIGIDKEVPRYLGSVRRRMPLGLVSNYPCGEALRRSLRLTGIDDLLDPIVISGEIGYVKPHGSLFAAALEALKVPAGKVLFVGDRWDADMIGAKNAGMKTCHHVGFTTDLDLLRRYETYRPDYQIRRLEELDGILFDTPWVRKEEMGILPSTG